MPDILERLTDTQNRHDAAAMAACFAPDYDSVQPVHPGRAFTGRDQVETNWTAVFAGVPDFRAQMRASVVSGDTVWGEFDWSGHHTDGTPFAMRGVIIVTVRDDLIAAARLYMEPVEQADEDIETAVQELYRPPES